MKQGTPNDDRVHPFKMQMVTAAWESSCQHQTHNMMVEVSRAITILQILEQRGGLCLRPPPGLQCTPNFPHARGLMPAVSPSEHRSGCSADIPFSSGDLSSPKPAFLFLLSRRKPPAPPHPFLSAGNYLQFEVRAGAPIGTPDQHSGTFRLVPLCSPAPKARGVDNALCHGRRGGLAGWACCSKAANQHPAWQTGGARTAR